MSDKIAAAVNNLAKVHDKRGGEIAKALADIGTHLQYLGNGDAATQMGAIEGLSKSVKEGLESLSSSVHEISDSIDRGA